MNATIVISIATVNSSVSHSKTKKCLPERRDEGQEQQPEPDEHEPVADAHRGPLQHPRVPEGLFEHVLPSRRRVVSAARHRLTDPDRRDHGPDRQHEQGDADGRKG
jgi:hypothetical protein